MILLPAPMTQAQVIEGAFYPAVEPPDTLSTLAEQIDFIARLCAARDFGLLPDWETTVEVRLPEWRQASRCLTLADFVCVSLAGGMARLASLTLLGACSSIYSRGTQPGSRIKFSTWDPSIQVSRERVIS